MNDNKFSFTDNGIDFIVFKHSGNKYALCFNGFQHGKSCCKYVDGGSSLESIAECYSLAETVKTANY